MDTPIICRDCLTPVKGTKRCPSCGGPRLLSHPELFDLSIAHMDCDAFYASVEKRDNPDLLDKPLIIGGGKRGVVSTACYNARIAGVRSAMPMFKALKLCPDAVVVKPRMSVYVEVSRAIKALMQDLTPVVEPLSLDEAFLDLTGTTRLHGEAPALAMARLVKRIEDEIGVSASVGLSHNKFLAKIASDLDKPRGFSVIGKAETQSFLAEQHVGVIWGVGPVMRQSLERKGIRKISDILTRDRKDLIEQFGSMGDRLWHLSRGLDYRHVQARAPVKSISNETTFREDLDDADLLDGHLWRLAENVAARAKASEKAGSVVNLKLKRADFKTLSRRVSLQDPTQLADTIYGAARPLLERELAQGPFRLIGVGLSNISDEAKNTQLGNLLDPAKRKRERVERATDAIREKFGSDAIQKGRALKL